MCAVADDQAAFGGGENKIHLHCHTGHFFIVQPRQFFQHRCGGGHVLVSADAKHPAAPLIGVVPVGEPCAGEHAFQPFQVGRGGYLATHRPRVYSSGGGYVFGALHPPLNF